MKPPPARGPSERRTSERLLAFTWVGHLPLALVGEDIVEIDAPSAEEPSADAQGDVDVFDLLGVSCELTRSERRVARVAEQGARSLLLGDRVELGSVDSELLLPLPSFLAGLSSQRGLLGFVTRAGTLFSIFDPALLLGLARARAPTPVGSSSGD